MHKLREMEKKEKRKFILPVGVRDWVETTVRDSWRRYKHNIKKYHFSKYFNMTERLKHRPLKVPLAHFKKLCEDWNKESVQAISEKNIKNRAQLKWVHRMGPKNFALLREKMRAKQGREPTQAEIFVETRRGNKGKQLDVETGEVISRLQEMVENEENDDTKSFEAVIGKERHGRVRCYGRNVTKTSLKRKLEINALKQAHNKEVAALRHDFEDKIGRLQNAFKTVMQQCNPQVSMEAIEDLLGLSNGDANSAVKETGPHVHSPTSAHTHQLQKRCVNEADANDDEDDKLFQDEDDDEGDEFQEQDEDDDEGEFQEQDEDDNEDDEFDHEQDEDESEDDDFQEHDVDDEF